MGRRGSGRNVLPQVSRDEAGQMADVGGGNDHVRHAEGQSLGGQDHVGVDGVISRGGLTLLACLRPKLGRLAHRRRGQRQILQLLAQGVEKGEAERFIRPQQFPANLVGGSMGRSTPSGCAGHPEMR